MNPDIPSSDEDFLAECAVETFRSSGPGGQNVNKRETAVRIRHSPTGIVVTCQRERSQYRNKQIALEELRRRLEALSQPPRPRIPTVIPRSVRKKILTYKKRRAAKKRLRKKPDIEE
ncbi:MAG: peptide chain release factor-like protein [Candidatus Bipolaricaulota bacterium]|nr:peptide chain release factor-like protein [Candidatus Bipolaricaulota bacterium]